MHLGSWLELFGPLEVSSHWELFAVLSLAMVSSQQLQHEAEHVYLFRSTFLTSV
jgi:hypothetical protein